MDPLPHQRSRQPRRCPRCGTSVGIAAAAAAAAEGVCPGCGAPLESGGADGLRLDAQRRAMERAFFAPAASPPPASDRVPALPLDALGRVLVSEAVAAGPIFRRFQLAAWRRQGLSIPHPPAGIATRYRRLFGREPTCIGQSPAYSLHEFVVLNLVVMPPGY